MTTSVISQLYSPSLELVLFVVVAIIDVFLALFVYLNNPRSATNIVFSLLTVITMIWLSITYAVSVSGATNHALILHRLGIFFAAPHSLLFFLFAYTVPNELLQLSRRTLYLVLGATFAVMLLNMSPYAFVGTILVNGATKPQVGPGILPFSILAISFSILAIYFLVRKYRFAEGVVRKQLSFVLVGMLTMLSFIIATILIPIAFFDADASFSFAPLYTLAFLGMSAYAITAYRLFNIKVLVTQALTIVIWVVLFAKLFGEESLNAQFIDGLVLAFTVIFGFFLVRSVKREVEQREEIERLSEEKSEFMTFASHEIRNPITAMRGYASLIADGTAGEVSVQVKDISQKILVEGNEVLNLISQFLSKSKMELGQISYGKAPFDIGGAVSVIADGYRPHAEQKGLELIKHVPEEKLLVNADEGKVKEVIGNLIDNSLKYTKEGSITVSAERHGVGIRVVISDTGVGIAPETLPQLFKKFSRADAQRVNLLGTGVGLYLAKTFIENMGGRIWAESEGEGRGARFIVEFSAST